MTNEQPKKTYLVTETARTFEVKANSAREATDLVATFGYVPNCPQCGTRFSVCGCVAESDEPDTSAEFLSCEGCPECEAQIFHDEETVTTTVRTIEQVKAENNLEGRTEYARSLLFEVRRTLARLEDEESNLRSWREGTRWELGTEEEKADKQRLDFLAGQIDAFESVKAYLKTSLKEAR